MKTIMPILYTIITKSGNRCHITDVAINQNNDYMVQAGWEINPPSEEDLREFNTELVSIFKPKAILGRHHDDPVDSNKDIEDFKKGKTKDEDFTQEYPEEKEGGDA